MPLCNTKAHKAEPKDGLHWEASASNRFPFQEHRVSVQTPSAKTSEADSITALGERGFGEVLGGCLVFLK